MHGLAFADDIVEAILGFHLALQPTIVSDETLELQSLVRTHHQTFVVERFENERISAFLHGFDGFIDRAVRGHDDDGQVRFTPFDFFQKFKPVHNGHFHIGNDQAYFFLFTNLQRFHSAVGGQRFKALFLQNGAEYGRIVLFVVNNKNGLHFSDLRINR